MELFLVLLACLASSKAELKVDKDDFAFDYGLSASAIEEYHYKISTSPSKRHRSGATLQSVNTQYANLQKQLQSLPSTDATNSVVQTLNSGFGSLTSTRDSGENLDKLQKVLVALDRNMGNLTGKDVGAMAKSVCDVIAAVAAYAPPPYGTIISTLVRLVSIVIGLKQGKPKSMGQIMQEVMQKELQQQYLQELKDKLRGAFDALEANQIFVNGYAGGKIKDRDYEFMISQFQVVKHFELRGQLMGPIERLAKSKKPGDAQDAVTLVDRYVTISSMVEVLLHTMRSILAQDEETQLSAKNLGETIEASRAKSQMYLNFVRNPKQENGLFMAAYAQNAPSNVETMLDSLKITPSATFAPGCYNIRNKYLDKDVSLKPIYHKSPLSYLVGRWREAKAAKFEFINSGKYWTIKAGKDLVCIATKADSLASGCQQSDTDLARFQVIPFVDGGYMILNEKFLANPIRMKKSASPLLGEPTATFHFINAEEKETWDEKNPQYIWELTSVTCGGSD